MITKIRIEWKRKHNSNKNIITDPKMLNLCSTKFWCGGLQQIQKKIECSGNEFIL